MEIKTLTPRLVGLELVQPALDAVCILLTHRAQNNATFVPCGNPMEGEPRMQGENSSSGRLCETKMLDWRRNEPNYLRSEDSTNARGIGCVERGRYLRHHSTVWG